MELETLGEHSNNASHSSLGEHFLVPLQQMARRPLRWNFESTVDEFHENIPQVWILKRINGSFHLRLFDGEEDFQGYCEGNIFVLLVFGADWSVLEDNFQSFHVLALCEERVDLWLI